MSDNPLLRSTSGVNPTLSVSEWDWRTTGTMPPPNGKCGSDTGDWLPAVTNLYFTIRDNKDVDQSALLISLGAGSQIRVQKATDSSNYSLWRVTATGTPSIETTYITFPVTFLESNGAPSAIACTCVFEVEASVPPEPPEPPYVTGGPPFPAYPTDKGRYGVSILDYFAAHVMSGLAMRPDMSLDVLKADGPKHAYWIAAVMVQLREELIIDPTPVPPEPPPEPETETILESPFLAESEPHGTVTVGGAPEA